MSTTLAIEAARGTYDVIIEPGVRHRIADVIGPPGRGLIVADSNVAATHASDVAASLKHLGWSVELTTVEAKESNKRVEAVAAIWQACLQAGLDRHSVLIAVGGGLTGDVAGFAAASYLRGIDVVQVPTTLLAMADASVGGKTGVNLPLPGQDRLGKNLAGAFWPPRCVLIDPETLETLSDREYRCGLAECVKHGMLVDSGLTGMIDDQTEPLLARQGEVVEALLAQAVKIKADIVALDEREAGVRMHLNLGHTFAHAVEPISQLDLRHGEAVAIGLCAACACSVALELVNQAWADDVQRRLARLGLPTRLPKPVPVDALLAAMHFDKKAHDGVLRLILPIPGGVVVRDDVPGSIVEQAWAAVTPE